MATSKIEIVGSSGSVEKCCDLCKLSGKRTVAIVYCRTCQQFQCASCSGMHKIPTLAEHSIDDIEDNAAGSREFNMRNLDYCNKHHKRFKFFCKIDSELCCSTCVISSHIHKCGGVGEIDTFIDTNEEEMQKIKSKIQDQKFSSAVLRSSGSKIKTQLRKDQADKLQKIDQVKDKVMQMFDLVKSEFKTKTDEAIGNIELDIDNDQASHTEIDEQRDTMDTFLDYVADEGNPRQIFTTLNIYNKQLEKFEKQLEQSCDKLSKLNIDFSFHEQLLKLVEMTEKIGEITIEKRKQYEPLKLHQVAAVDVKKSVEDKFNPLTSGLDFMPDGRIVTLDLMNDKCLIMSEQLSVLSQSKVKTFPLDVAVMPGDRIAVSSRGYQLSTYTVNQDNTLTELNMITTTSLLFSLCTLDDKTLVANTINTERPAKKVAITGEETDFKLPWKTSRYEYNESKTTYIPSLDMLVLTDRRRNRCCLWNVKERTKIAVEDERIKEPMGVCATRSGIIYLCSSSTKAIVQISPTGKILGSTRLSDGRPFSVALSHDDKLLLVFYYDANKLQLFNLK